MHKFKQIYVIIRGICVFKDLAYFSLEIHWTYFKFYLIIPFIYIMLLQKWKITLGYETYVTNVGFIPLGYCTHICTDHLQGCSK